jgi:hypothetical protein
VLRPEGKKEGRRNQGKNEGGIAEGRKDRGVKGPTDGKKKRIMERRKAITRKDQRTERAEGRRYQGNSEGDITEGRKDGKRKISRK